MLSDPVGIGMRPPHYDQLANESNNIGWLEVHSENYFDSSSEATYYLDKVSERYPISLHGIGLSLGSNDLIDTAHVNNIKKLINRYQPLCVSEHLSWSTIAGLHFNNLLPLPYTEESLKHVVKRIDNVQQIFGREILIENPASYSVNKGSTLSEPDFLQALQAETKCKILLDFNNIYISSVNTGVDAIEYLNKIPAEIVGEIHLSGSKEILLNNNPVFLDTHCQKVSKEVWQLFELYLQKSTLIPTLIEWDSNIPTLQTLLKEAGIARMMIHKANQLKEAS